MSILGALFGTKLPPAKLYVDCGMSVTQEFVSSLGLTGWLNGCPIYSAAEQSVIENELTLITGGLIIHEEIVPQIYRLAASGALANLADASWRFSDSAPPDWRINVSRYLKSWVSSLNPWTLVTMAKLLDRVGHKGEAKRTLQVVLLFPTYARTKEPEGLFAPDQVDILIRDAKQLIVEINAS